MAREYFKDFKSITDAFEKGFICEKFPAGNGDEFFEGNIGYHLRKGCHYFSREDWLKLIKFVNMHKLWMTALINILM